ncbi:MAG: hypothetical protein P4L61_01355 [Candidatus Pacebacteria bacterium]|nr:hypothetical protein [Candidatus Paceibacterota bacterium]
MNPEEVHPLNALAEQTTDEERKKQAYPQKSLRTLEGDIQEAIQERNASSASMVMAQQKKTASDPVRGRRASAPGSSKKKMLIIIASMLLVALGVGGGYYLYLESPLASSVPVTPVTAAHVGIMTPDSQKTIDIGGLGSGAARAAVQSAFLNAGNENGSIMQIIPTEKGSTGTVSAETANDFLASVALPAPNVLSRSLNDEWMLGTYNDNGTPAPFMILTDNFFQNAYAGMISWENTMPDDFASVFGYAAKAVQQNGTSTSTSTSTGTSTTTATSTRSIGASASTLASYFTIQGSFRDAVIENKDVRAFFDSNGDMLIIYSFVNNDTIVITTDDNALAGIINRLEKQTFIR